MPDVTTLTFWVLFHVFLGIAIYVDLFLLNRENTNNNMKLNLATVAMWIAVGLGFGFFVWNYKGPQSAMNYWTGYLLEQSLSVDNLFVFLVIFQYFAVNSRISGGRWCGASWRRSCSAACSSLPAWRW